MQHRHLVDTQAAARSPTAIDDIIARGLWADWMMLRQWCDEQPSLLDVVIISGVPMRRNGAVQHPDWEKVISAAARLQRHFPDAVLVGGTAAGIHSGHRFSRDADHVLTDLRQRFNDVLADLESVAGWKTARVRA